MKQDLSIQENKKNSSELPINLEQLEQFKSLFYLFKGKRDTQVKLFNNNKTFTKQSILDLNRRIQEKLLLHDVPNSSISISFNLSKNRIKTFGNWTEFENERWETNDETESIILNWDFEIVLPNRVHTIPQTHSLRVRIGNEVKPSEFLHLLMVGSDEFELEESSSQMVCKVDFVNNTIANELLNQVEEWYNTLNENISDNKINNFFNNNGNKISYISEVFIVLGGYLLLYPILSYFIFNSNKILDLRFVFIIVASLFLSNNIFNRIANLVSMEIRTKMMKLKGTSIFQITTGDNHALVKTNKKNKSLQREIYLKIFVSIISSGVLFIIGYIIKEFIKYFTK